MYHLDDAKSLTMPQPIPRVPDDDVEITKEDFRHAAHDWQRFFYSLISALNNRVGVTGSVTFVAATTAAVTFATAEKDALYDVWFSSPEDNFLWATSKTTAGFTANAKNSTSATFRYQLIRA